MFLYSNISDPISIVNLKISINYETTTTVDIWRENIYSYSSNNYCIYNNGGLTTSGKKLRHHRKTIQAGLLHWINSSPLFSFSFQRSIMFCKRKLYGWFFRLWYEPKDLKWWHSFLCQGVRNLNISWYPRDLCNFFSLDHFSQNSHLYVKSLVQNLGGGMYWITEAGIVHFAEDFNFITVVFQLQYL